MDSPPLPNPAPHPVRIASSPMLRGNYASSGGSAALYGSEELEHRPNSNNTPNFAKSRERIREEVQHARAERGIWAHSGSSGSRNATLRRGRSEGDVAGNGQPETWLEFLRTGPDQGVGTGSQHRSESVERRMSSYLARREAARRRSLSGLLGPGGTRSQGDLGNDNSTIWHPLSPPLESPSTSHNMPPPPPPPPISRRISVGGHGPGDRRSREIVLPKWQPDNEVSKCPICQTQFTFWYRKHHCRKCGRVVCANCSPHRITIPRQFIVQPPRDPGTATVTDNMIDITQDESISQGVNEVVWQSSRPATITQHSRNETGLDPALGGGAEVRICNPCVPDPNNEPPPQQSHQSRPVSGTESRHLPVEDSISPHGRFVNIPGPHQPVDQRHQRQPNTLPPAEGILVSNMSPSANARRNAGFQAYSGQTGGEAPRSITNSMAARFGRASGRSRGYASLGSEADFAQIAQNRRMGDPYGPYAAGAETAGPSGPRSTWSPLPPPPQSASSSVPACYPLPQAQHHHRHTSAVSGSRQPNVRSMLDVEDYRPPPPPRASQPTLHEDDYCPVCHQPLPPRRPDGNEDDREAHIDDCIQQSLYGGGGSSNQRTSSSRRTSVAQSLQSIGATAESRSSSTGSAQRRRRNTGGRMVTFRATEKDCVGEGRDGQAECIICFEDIEVGVKMARLECLCKFHEGCIKEWWEKKEPGACPVHQDNGF